MASPRHLYRRRDSKRQTRLQFSSLPSSSPQKTNYSPALQDRLSRVTHTGIEQHNPKAQEDAYSPLISTSSSQPQSDDSSPVSEPPATPPTDNLAPASVSEDEDELITPISKRRKISGGVTSLSTPLRRSARFHSSPTPAHSQSPGVGLEDSALGQAESTDDDADVLASAPTRRHRTPAKKKASYVDPIREDDWLVDDDQVEHISSDSEPVQKRKVRSRRRIQKERREIEADLEDLQDSGGENWARKQRTRGGPITTQRDVDQEHFQLLKRRRAGEKIPRVYDSADEENESNDAADINLIGQPTRLDEEGSEQSSLDTEPEQEELQEEEDWIEEDDQTAQNGRRPESGVPLEFTRFATAKPRELFFHIIEWLIKNRIAPAFPRDDEIFRLAFRKVDDEVSAQAGSRLISSAWNAEFKYTILARPDIAISPKDVEDDIHCDACNKTNHPAKYDVVISGQPYHAKTLEPVEPDSDDEGDNMDVDEKGRMLAPQNKHFYLGSHCAANAQMGHKLSHWKYHLNETVLQYLIDQNVLSDQQIVAREKKNKKQREKEAEAVVDSMEETGKVKELWSEFKRDLKDAMLGMIDYNVKGGRSAGRVGVVRTKTDDGSIKEWHGDKYREMRYYSPDTD